MNKEAFLEETYNSAFEDELEKLSFKTESAEQLYKAMAKASKTKHTPQERKMHIERLKKIRGIK